MYMKDFNDNTFRNNNSADNQNYNLTAHEITFEEAMNALNDAYNGDVNAQYIYGKY